MKQYNKLKRFPLGTIKAEGFLKEQLLIGKEGMAGHLYELEPEMIRDPYINKSYVKRWGPTIQSGWSAEISGNYWTGYIQHAFTLGDEEMINIATDWVNKMMTKQKEDGYLGTYYEEDARIYEDYNAWGTSCAMRGLIAFYEATGRQDVLDAVHRCMLWFCDKWAGDNKTSYCGVAIIEIMVFCYYYTKDKRLLDFAEDYAEYVCNHDLFSTSYKVFLEGDYHYYTNHTAGLGIHIRLYALLYTITGKKEYLKASERIISQIRKHSVQLSGAPVSSFEYLGPVSSTGEAEYCSFTFYNVSYSYMSYITGEAKYGDYMEEMFYNGAQGARKKDEKAIAYLSAPNQIYATLQSSTEGAEADMQVYSPCYPTSCCPVNSVVVVPEFIRGMMLTDDNYNVYMTAYGPCSMKYKDVSIKEETLYPFRNNVRFVIDANREFAINFKIPAWAKGYKVTVNNEATECYKNSFGYAEIFRKWGNNDVVEISFDADVEVIRVDDSDAAKKYPVAFKYGALLFSYHIPEDWQPCDKDAGTPLPEGWTWWTINPSYEEPDGYDMHENLSKKKYAYTWNVAVDENLKKEDVEIEFTEPCGYAWENPMISLKTTCYKAPYFCPPYPIKTIEPFGDRQYVTDKLPLKLVPYGCTNLRITYFPIADL